MRKHFAIVAFITALVLAGCASNPRSYSAGSIWNVAHGRLIDERALFERLAATRFVLLGEAHDNPHHHALQARVLREMVARGRRPALVMEMFDVDQQAALDAAVAEAATADALAERARFDFKGWTWRYYRELVVIALEERLAIIAANLSRTALRGVIARGFDALGEGQAAWLGLPPVLPDARLDTLRREIIEGHCNRLPPNAIDGMVRAQQARDATMAEALQRFPDRGALLIAGVQHVRRDVAVPVYLSPDVRARDTLVLAFVEASGEADPAARLGQRKGLSELFDYVWITQSVEREDPCAALGEAARPNKP